MKNSALLLLLGFTILLSYQNCGKVAFRSQDGVLVAKTDTEEVSTIGVEPTPSEPPEVVDPTPTPSEPPVEPPGVEPTPTPGEPPVGPTPKPPGNGGGGGGGANGEYICILEGPGKSVRLGMTTEFLFENGHTPDTVCMTREACTEIVSQKFNVKGPEWRGFCKNGGGHSIKMSNDEIQEKLDQLQ